MGRKTSRWTLTPLLPLLRVFDRLAIEIVQTGPRQSTRSAGHFDFALRANVR